MDGIWLHEDSIKAKCKHTNHTCSLTKSKIAYQHNHNHYPGISQHKRKDTNHTLVGPTHFQGLDQSRDCYALTGAGIAKDRRRGAPHIGRERILHRKQDRGQQHEQHINRGCGDDVNDLSGDPGSSIRMNKIERCAGGQEGHIRKEHHQQHRGQQNGIAVTKAPNEGLHELQGGVMIHRKADCLIGQQKAEDEGQGEGHNDSGIAPPEPEVVPGDGKGLF